MEQELKDDISGILGTAIRQISSIRGGDIGNSYLVETSEDRYFCKIYEQDNGSEMAKAEYDGLEFIRKTNTVNTPEVFACKNHRGKGLLLLEYIEAGSTGKKAMQQLGEQLAAMHLLQQDSFGLETDNFIGSLPQDNSAEESWLPFYVKRRLQPQLQLAVDKGLLRPEETPSKAQLTDALVPYLDKVAPSLLHGDLWGGNYMVSSSGKPYLVDPAVYRGHSEVDLAMSRLFGAFPAEFYSAYEAAIPPGPGFKERQDWYQLYYLLMHLNVFGSSYRSSVTDILKRRL